MVKTTASLRREIAALEAKLEGKVKPKRQISANEKARRSLLAQLKDLKSKVGMYMQMPMDEDMDDIGMMPMDEDMDVYMEEEMPVDEMAMGMPMQMPMEETGMMYMDDEEEPWTASIVDPDAIEESIGDDYLSEMAKLTGKTDIPTDETIDDTVGFDEEAVGVTASASRKAKLLKRASLRLDRLASYCEKHGRVKLAYQIDKIADAVDARIKRGESVK